MATRSTVSVEAPSGSIHLYRHYDGGPWGNGVSLARLLRRFRLRPGAEWFERDQFATRLARRLLALPSSRRQPESLAYDLTLDPAQHGDREWHWRVEAIGAGELRVSAFRVLHVAGDRQELRRAFSGSVAELRRWVAAELRAMRQRMRDNAARMTAVRRRQLDQAAPRPAAAPATPTAPAASPTSPLDHPF